MSEARVNDIFAPAHTTLVVATKARDRYWDGDAVRTEPMRGDGRTYSEHQVTSGDYRGDPTERPNGGRIPTVSNPAGAPLLDFWKADDPKLTTKTEDNAMGQARYLVADVFEGLRSLPDNSVDLVMSSPPFLALRSYLPADHPDKGKEIGSEATPGAFLDVLLDVVEECARVLAPHGSLVFELGDTYSGSAGDNWHKSAPVPGERQIHRHNGPDSAPAKVDWSQGWPLDKSKVLVPQLFAISLAYGFNPLTGRTTDPWRVRNTVAWCRPNPPVGRDGDKFRPATSFLTVACKARDRYWDGDAVRTQVQMGREVAGNNVKGSDGNSMRFEKRVDSNPAGAPLLDWWEIPTAPYRGVWQGDTLYRASQDCPEHSLRAIRQRLQTAGDGELREALLRNSRRTDASPALKQTCVRFANSDLGNPVRHEMLDWLDRSIQSERTTESTHASRTPAPPNGDSRSAAARTVDRTSRTPTQPTSTDQTMEQLPLGHEPTATPHSTASSRTVPALATSLAGTPSVETPGDTARTSKSPESSAPHRDTRESSNDASASDGPLPESGPSTVRTPSRRCSCEHYTESASHYATYPPNLVVPIVKSMCPAKVCRVCGKPSERIVESERLHRGEPVRDKGGIGRSMVGSDPTSAVADVVGMNGQNTWTEYTTLGWSDCGHDNYRSGLVLDPFAGSGTTLQVATGHGRDAIGIDIDSRNAELAVERIGGLFLSVEELKVA